MIVINQAGANTANMRYTSRAVLARTVANAQSPILRVQNHPLPVGEPANAMRKFDVAPFVKLREFGNFGREVAQRVNPGRSFGNSKRKPWLSPERANNGRRNAPFQGQRYRLQLRGEGSRSVRRREAPSPRRHFFEVTSHLYSLGLLVLTLAVRVES